MKLVVGLGNSGIKYEHTRHNVGFMVVDELAKKLSPVGKTTWKGSQKFNSQLYISNSRLIFAKPQTMMNASGSAVKKIMEFYHTELAEVWVVHDDLDLPLGKIKIRVGGGTAGHRGLESIVEKIGSAEFIRFRLGIGHPGVADEDKHKKVERYVLESFSGKEVVEAEKMVKKAVEAIVVALKEGIERAMNKFNLK